jgi:hypothetical protein
VGELRWQFRERLERLKPVHTCGEIVRGSDIVFIEEVVPVGSTPTWYNQSLARTFVAYRQVEPGTNALAH